MKIQALAIETPHPHREGAPRCFVLHTTGTSHLDQALAYYQKNPEGIAPHYVIDCQGQIYRLVQDDEIAYHCGYGTGVVPPYAQGFAVWSRWAGKPLKEQPGPFSGYLFWAERWPGRASPLELLTGPHPNAGSLGIEMLAPHHLTPAVFTDEQYAACAQLLADKATAYRIPLDREHVLGHEDVNPCARSDARGGTDPGRGFDWERILQAARAALQADAGGQV